MKTPILLFPHSKEATLIERKNRFLGIVKTPSFQEGIPVHIHDSGRLPDLLYPGNKVLIVEARGKNRKTKWDIIGAKDKDLWVFTHSGYHNSIAKTLLIKGYIPGIKDIKGVIPEPRIENKRLDLLLKSEKSDIWVEVKGCTLKEEGVALFPDAPTKRGQKHLETLIKLKKNGGTVILVFLIFRTDATCFSPNYKIDPYFYHLFLRLLKVGIKVYPILLSFDTHSLYYEKILPICILPNKNF